MKPLGIDGAPEFHWPKPWVTRTLIMQELPQPRETYVQIGGDFLEKGERVSPGVPAVLSSKPVTGSRLDLAKWLVDPSNPLTARVTVNRMWQAYFGKGIVETQDDFGLMGAAPTHPELQLDWLATEFIARGWAEGDSSADCHIGNLSPVVEGAAGVGKSRSLQQPAREGSSDCAWKPKYPRFGPRGERSVAHDRWSERLSADPGKRNERHADQTPMADRDGPNRYRRGMYTFFFNSLPAPALALFGTPDTRTTPARGVSGRTVPLTIDAADEAFSLAQAMARRIESPNCDLDRLNYAYLAATGRRGGDPAIAGLRKFLVDGNYLSIQSGRGSSVGG